MPALAVVNTQNQIDPNVQVRFFAKEVRDDLKSQQTGMEATRREVWVEFTKPGPSGRLEVTPMRVTDAIKKQFANHWTAYEQGVVPEPEGTSLNEFPMISQGMREAFQKAGVRTIEGLVAASDDVLRYVGTGARKAQAEAKAWIDASSNTGKMAAKQVAQDAEIAKLHRTVERLEKALAESNNSLKKRGGEYARPPINEDEDELIQA